MESKKKPQAKKAMKKEEENEPIAIKKQVKKPESEDLGELPPPKKPKSAYIAFSMEKRSEVLKKNPDLKGKEVMKQLGKLWNQLPDNERKQYIDMQVKDRERYERQIKDYKATGKYYDERGDVIKPIQSSKRKTSAPLPNAKRKPAGKSKK